MANFLSAFLGEAAHVIQTRNPVKRGGPASQPTLSRFEISFDRADPTCSSSAASAARASVAADTIFPMSAATEHA